MGIFKKSNLTYEDPVEVICRLKDQDCSIWASRQKDSNVLDQLAKLIPIKLTASTAHRAMKAKIMLSLKKDETEIATKVKRSTVNDLVITRIILNILEGVYSVRYRMFDRFSLDITFKIHEGSLIGVDNYEDRGQS